MMNKTLGGYLTLLIYFLGIGFISGSIVHFTLNPWRFGLLGIAGGILFAISTYIQDFASHDDQDTSRTHIMYRVLTGVMLSIGLGMISGSIQHFDEITMQALRYIPIGVVLSTVARWIQERTHSMIKPLQWGAIALGLTLVSIVVSQGIQQLMFPGMGTGGHHSGTGGHHGDDSSMGDMMHMVTSEEQFIAEMIPHHQEAIDTSRIIVTNTQDPMVRQIAQNIIDGQSNEVEILKTWLADWYSSSDYVPMYQNMMRPLDKLSGHDLDDRYMKDMIMHHEGAIQMAEQVLILSQRPEIVKFANDVIAAQSIEINQFSKLLDHSNKH